MTKIDLKRELSHLYAPTARGVTEVDVPALNFLMVDGAGDPNTSAEYKAAVEALYAVSYALKFAVKKGQPGIDYVVMPLEGLWWTEGGPGFDVANRDRWRWTVMILQPEYVTADLFDGVRQEVEAKKRLDALSRIRFETYREDRAAQILYVGPYAEEAATIERVHRFIAEQGGQLTGKHHEIYLSDPSRTAPDKLKTIIRQPFA